MVIPALALGILELGDPEEAPGGIDFLESYDVSETTPAVSEMAVGE